jgi:transcriptional regulator with PAS, ATPase and Fis domain
VNCAALPEALLESELFGHVRGAFTGAVNDRPGRFELAHQGTLFLDEIGDLPLPLQGKLLRVLQDRSVDRLGSGRPIPIDLRIIAATNRDLTAMIAEGRFRQDLYYRLAVVPLHLPPLRERLEDLPAMAAAFLHKLSKRLPSTPAGISPAALSVLAKHDWPGNVRELENALEFAAIRASSGVIEPQDLPPHLHHPAHIFRAPELPERERIAAALRQAANAAEAARRLGLSRATLFRRMRQLGLAMPRRRTASPHHRPA